MSHEALIADLRQKSAARINQLRADAEQQVEKFRKEKQKEFEEQQAEALRQQASEVEKVAAPILHDAKRQALALEDEAMGRLVTRLYALAESLLVRARENDYESTFAALVQEIPGVAWEKIRVNPGDKELAEKFFPESSIEMDPAIIGGFLASTDGGKYQVVNTLKRRLEKGWTIILPEVLQDIIRENDA